jgi:probable rRNA maturation factor
VTAPALHLSVQYASARAAPPRDRIRRWVVATLRAITGPAARLTVRFVDEPEGRALNHRYRGRNYATNVLTFAYPDPDGSVEGDIVVCMPVVEAEASAQQKDPTQHCAHLIVHGTLHACGHDHVNATDADAMEAIERAVLARFGIVDPYRIEDANG